MKRANGTGTVYKLQGHRRRPWIARKGSAILGYYTTKKDALTALERTAGQRISDTFNATFAEVFRAWSGEHFPRVGQTMADEYTRSFNRMSEFHDRKFRELRTHDYQMFIDAYPTQTRSAMLKFKELLSGMTKWAMREEIVAINFAQFIELPHDEKKERRIFTDLEIEKLKMDDDEFSKMTLIMIYTGMRISEFCSLTLSAYHEDYVVAGVKTDAGKNRCIPLSPTAKKLLDEFVRAARENNSDEIIPWKVSNFRRRYYLNLERLGIEHINPHSTRHTFASLCRRDGVPPEILKRIMGHSDYSITANVYVHVDNDELVNAIQKLG